VHLADGILQNPALIVALDAVGVGAAALMVRRVERSERSPFWTGTLAAFVLAIQAVNVPAAPGASAHAIGAGLLAFTLGSAEAVLALSAVLVAQALLFADGGLSVIGINLLNIAVIPVIFVELARRLFGRRRLALSAIVGVTLGNALAASSLALALVLGAGVRPAAAFGWLVGVQTLAGLVEGIITAIALRELASRAPALLTPSRRSMRLPGRQLAFAAAFVGVALALVPFATDLPDALGRALGQARPAP
jgi:cobalt/nickel transport system permease protein